MLYWLVATAVPSTRPWRLALAALAAAFAIEFFKLVHAPSLDAFRHTLAGRLLLGRFFSVANLVAYACGVAAIALVDWARVRRGTLP